MENIQSNTPIPTSSPNANAIELPIMDVPPRPSTQAGTIHSLTLADMETTAQSTDVTMLPAQDMEILRGINPFASLLHLFNNAILATNHHTDACILVICYEAKSGWAFKSASVSGGATSASLSIDGERYEKGSSHMILYPAKSPGDHSQTAKFPLPSSATNRLVSIYRINPTITALDDPARYENLCKGLLVCAGYKVIANPGMPIRVYKATDQDWVRVDAEYAE